MRDALAEFPAHAPPERLFTFCKASGLRILTDGRLKITPPDQFNDPFEVLPGVSLDGVAPEDVRHSMLKPKSLWRQRFQLVRGSSECGEAGFCRWVDEFVENPCEWEGRLLSLRDCAAASFSELYGVTCFSAFSEQQLTDSTGTRQWSMYADSHQGMAIEFDGGCPLITNWVKSKWLFPVDYQDARFAVGFREFEDWSDAGVFRVVRRWPSFKCAAWGNESEWRLVHPLTFVVGGEEKVSSLRRKWADPVLSEALA
jgi:hypothetical protein